MFIHSQFFSFVGAYPSGLALEVAKTERGKRVGMFRRDWVENVCRTRVSHLFCGALVSDSCCRDPRPPTTITPTRLGGGGLDVFVKYPLLIPINDRRRSAEEK